jgi:Lysyl oxidase
MPTRIRLALAIAAAFIPVLWLAAGATGGKAPSGGTGLLPDLQSAVPHHLGVQNQQQGETLRFANLIGNTGPGDLRLRPETDFNTNETTGFQEIYDSAGNLVIDRPASTFVFHPAHNHWHIDRVAQFEIRHALDDGTRGRFGAVFSNQSIKTTFCLIDVVKLEGNSHTTERTYWDCFADAVQGISSGWGDQYHHSLEGQELNITNARPGIYYVVSISNPDGNFLEETQANNTAWTSFRLTRDSQGNAKVAEIAHSACSGTLCGADIPNR